MKAWIGKRAKAIMISVLLGAFAYDLTGIGWFDSIIFGIGLDEIFDAAAIVTAWICFNIYQWATARNERKS